jgi:hypothetical protein
VTAMDTSFPDRATPPRHGVVFRAQLRTLGAALRREAMLLAGLTVLVTVIALNDVIDDGAQLDFPTDAGFVLPLLGLIAPFVVWKGERLYRDAHLWTLPVDRQAHIALKVAAGGVWLLAAVAAVSLWLMVLAMATGGAVFGPHDRLLLAGPLTSVVTPAQVQTIAWTTPVWQWASLFTGPAIAYLLGSALVVGLRYPLRWVVGAVLLLMLLALVWSEEIVEVLLQALVMSPVGLDYVLTGGAEGLDADVLLASGRRATAWRALPTAGPWAVATGFWLVLALALVWVASWRHRER